MSLQGAVAWRTLIWMNRNVCLGGAWDGNLFSPKPGLQLIPHVNVMKKTARPTCSHPPFTRDEGVGLEPFPARVADVMDPEYAEIKRLKERLLRYSGWFNGSEGSERSVRSGLCVVPSRSPEQLLQSALSPVTESGGSFPTATQKAGDFDVEASKLRLVGLCESLKARDEAQARANPSTTPLATLDLGNEQLVRAAGGLLRFLDQNRLLLGQLEGGSSNLAT